MSINKNDIIIRTILWNGNNKRCFYCTELIDFNNLEIDHIIPQNTSEQELNKIRLELNLELEFELNSFDNLVPTHHNCNNRKSSKKFSESSLRYFLELWKDKIPSIVTSYQKLLQHSQNEKLLLQIGIAINKGQLNLNEIVSFVNNSCNPPEKKLEPIIISLGVNIFGYMEEQNIDIDYVQLCDNLETNLLEIFNEKSTLIYKQTESERNGETLSIRFAIWNIDLDKLNTFIPRPWEILEIASYSEVYNDSWKGFFDESDPIFGLAR